jgi:hypothetical protein
MIEGGWINQAPASEAARDALRKTREERARVPYLATREGRRLEVPTSLLDVTGSRPSSGVAFFLAGAVCAALILAALYFSL